LLATARTSGSFFAFAFPVRRVSLGPESAVGVGAPLPALALAEGLPFGVVADGGEPHARRTLEIATRRDTCFMPRPGRKKRSPPTPRHFLAKTPNPPEKSSHASPRRVVVIVPFPLRIPLAGR
jgi:hypothetical protein